MDLTKEAIEKIEEMSKVETFEFNGHTYTSKPVTRVKGLSPATLKINTLDSFVELIKAEIKKFPNPLFVCIGADAQTVTAYSTLKSDAERDVPYSAIAILPHFRFGEWLNIEDMIISLKSKFIQTEDTDKLVSLLGNITSTESVSVKDDGFTQNVEARKGISMVQNIDIKPIIKLKPYRTFLEVEQPESEFLFRLKDGRAAIFEADGGKWILEAKKNIQTYLKTEFPSVLPVVVTN